MEDKKFSELIRAVKALKAMNPTELDISQIVKSFTQDDNLSVDQRLMLESELKKKVKSSTEVSKTYYDATDYF